MNSIIFENKELFPSKVVCVGRNYVEHIKELGNEMPSSMVLFNKPNSAICSELYYFNEHTRFEGELCFLIEGGKISGIGFGLDLTKADIQNELKRKGLPWERAKAFDKSAVLSEFIRYEGRLEDLGFKLFVNNKLQQEANFDLMIYKPLDIIKEIKTFQTLQDGDIVMSGTPKGVATYNRGDHFKAVVYEKEKEILSWEAIVK